MTIHESLPPQTDEEFAKMEEYYRFDRAMEFAEKHGMTREAALARYAKLRMELENE